MHGAVQRRKVVSFVSHFGPPALVWSIGFYLLYRATQLDGVVSGRSFVLGALLVICGMIIGSARRSRQTTTRERALESSLVRTNQRIRALEQRFDRLEQKLEQVIMDVHTDNAVRALREATEGTRGVPDAGKPYMRLVSKENLGEG